MKQRVYEILYRELVENYANSKGRTNTAFLANHKRHILCIWVNYMYYRPCKLYTVRISLRRILGGRHINCFIHLVMLAYNYAHGETIARL